MTNINQGALYLRRLYPEQPIVGVGAVIIFDGKILLEKRKNEPGKGKWSIPGGLVDLGESLTDAVIREAQEETCLEVENPRLLDVVDNVELDSKGRVKYHFVIIDYLLKTQCKDFRVASDADELRWVDFDDVEEFDLTQSFRLFFERNRPVLEKVNF